MSYSIDTGVVSSEKYVLWLYMWFLLYRFGHTYNAIKGQKQCLDASLWGRMQLPSVYVLGQNPQFIFSMTVWGLRDVSLSLKLIHSSIFGNLLTQEFCFLRLQARRILHENSTEF